MFEVMSESPLKDTEIYSAVKDSLQAYVGILGTGKAGLQFIKEKWDKQNQCGIARVSHTSVDMLKASFVLIHTINNKKARVRSLGTSGTIEKAQKKYLLR